MAKEILIAESDKMVQKEFERIFATTDHHLVFTTNDKETLFRGKLSKPDLIIGGKHLCQTVRVERDMEDVPFIILLDMFEDVSDTEQKLLRPDGIISRPFNENEVLSMVNQFSNGVRERAEEKILSNDRPDWKSFSGMGAKKTDQKEDFSLDESWETDEEIIELVDVVEEPESRMSIDDFALQHKEEFVGEIAPIESWETPRKEAEDLEKEFILSPGEKEEELEETPLRLEEETGEKKVAPEDEFFEKIELEEILQKVERLQPSIEKEWLVEEEGRRTPKIVPDAFILPPQKPGDQYSGLDEFEAALRGEDKTEPAEETLEPIFYQEMPPETPQASFPEEGPVELELQELGDEEFPEVFLDELIGELEKLKEEEIMTEKAAVGTEAETTMGEEISELLGEDIQPLQRPPEEATPMEPLPPLQIVMPAEEITFLEELTQGEELREPWEAGPEVTEAPEIGLEETPPFRRLDRKIEEVIAKGVQEMMQDFINKVIPEMATQMITLTMDRIETMVKEIVPDLAERAIREEIRRLQKGEKD